MPVDNSNHNPEELGADGKFRKKKRRRSSSTSKSQSQDRSEMLTASEQISDSEQLESEIRADAGTSEKIAIQSPQKRRRRRQSVDNPIMVAGFEPKDFNGKLYRWLDWITEGLIYLMVVFTVWAFGSVYTLSQDWFGRFDWAAWWMTLAGMLLFVMWVGKASLRKWGGVKTPRWDTLPNRPKAKLISKIWSRGLFIIGALVVLYTLISAWNARADYFREGWKFNYHESYISWLPHSYDAPWTWRAFRENLGLFCSFWAIRDWLMGKSEDEAQEWEKRRRLSSVKGVRPVPMIPSRLRRLLWVVCVNAGILGVESILQRLSGTGKVLWMVTPMTIKNAAAQFGPYPYRSNGAQFFNMIWPVCLGFWWAMKRTEEAYKKYGRHDYTNSHPILLPTLFIVMICPVVSTSRGASVLMGVGLVICAVLLFKSNDDYSLKSIGWISAVMVIVLFGATYLGWDDLSKRLATQGLEDKSREVASENANEMIQEFFWLGSGPKTFGSIMAYYVGDPSETHLFYNLHNDWKETLITYGFLCGILILAGLGLVLSYWAVGAGGAPTHWSFPWFVIVGMGTCLAHARFDFPFQVYSLIFYFVLLCAILTSTCRRKI